MNGPGRLRLAVGAVGGALTGLLAGLLIGAMMDGERGRSVVGYTLGVMPLAALMGATAAAWFARTTETTRSSRLFGGLFAVGAAVAVSLVLGAIRFRVAGATGLISTRALWYTAEFLMVVGLLPAVAMLGAGAVRRWETASALGRPVAPLALGATAALLAGPVVIGVAALAALATPVTVTILVVILIVTFRVRLP